MITELEFKSLALQGYNRIPLIAEAFADLGAPLSLYLKLAHAKGGGELIEALTPAQLLKIAGGNMLLCRFRFDNRVLGEMLSGYVKDKIMASSHAAVLMAGQKAESIAA